MDSWVLCEGETIADGRSVLRHLGGGRRHEVDPAWDDRLRAIVVAKLLRPDLVADERALAALAAEAALLEFLHLEFVGPGRVFLVAAVDLTGDDSETKAAARLADLGRRVEERELVERAMITLSRPDAPALTSTP